MADLHQQQDAGHSVEPRSAGRVLEGYNAMIFTYGQLKDLYNLRRSGVHRRLTFGFFLALVILELLLFACSFLFSRHFTDYFIFEWRVLDDFETGDVKDRHDCLISDMQMAHQPSLLLLRMPQLLRRLGLFDLLPFRFVFIFAARVPLLFQFTL